MGQTLSEPVVEKVRVICTHSQQSRHDSLALHICAVNPCSMLLFAGESKTELMENYCLVAS